MDKQLMSQLQAFLASGPERLAAEIALGALVLIILSIYLHGPIATVCRIAVFIGAMAVIIGGTAILMNNVSLAGPPNPAIRLQRFVTVNWAATSDKGEGDAPCAAVAELIARQPVDAEHHEHHRPHRAVAHAGAEAAPANAIRADEAEGEAQQGFPELVRQAYPGIPPARLMQVAAATASGLPGWQVVSSDPKTLTLN